MFAAPAGKSEFRLDEHVKHAIFVDHARCSHAGAVNTKRDDLMFSPRPVQSRRRGVKNAPSLGGHRTARTENMPDFPVKNWTRILHVLQRGRLEERKYV